MVPEQSLSHHVGATPNRATTELTKAPCCEPTTADYCRALPLSDDACRHWEQGIFPLEFLIRLSIYGLYPDAITLMAALLRSRAAVAWAIVCVRENSGTLDANADAALQAAEQWVYEPTEANRAVAERAAAAAGAEEAATWLARAAAQSGGLSPSDKTMVLSPATVRTAHAVAGALILVATQGDPMHAAARYQSFLQLGRRFVHPAGPTSELKAD